MSSKLKSMFYRSPKDLRKALQNGVEGWEGITADNIISITYNSQFRWWEVYWRVPSDEQSLR